VFDVAPEATVTDAGTVSRALLLDNETTAPPEGAACVNVTVQVDETPVPRLEGAHDTELGTTGAVKLKIAVLMMPT
jgi:hypothetical protein